MNYANVMDQLAASVDGIEGLRVFGYPAPAVVPPAVVVGWPDPIDDETLPGSAETIMFPVLVVVGKADVKAARDALGVYLDRASAYSVQNALENGLYSTCDSVQVLKKHINPVTIAGVEYLAAILDVEVTGKGI